MPELQQARGLWVQNRFAAALELFAAAVRKEPNNPIALADAARAFGSRFEIEKAERMLRRLVDLAGDRADLLQIAGQSYRMIQRPDSAADCLESALRADPRLLASRLELAMLYERQNRLEEAAEHIDVCLDHHRDSIEAAFLLGRLLRRQGQYEQAAKQLQSIARSQADWSVRAQAWSELAQLQDALGKFADAMKSVSESKAILAKHARRHRQRAQFESEHTENVIRELQRNDMVRWQKDAQSLEQRQVALLTGPPRSGTTVLEKVLDAHPHIVTSDEQVAFPKFVYPSLIQDTDGLLSVAHLHSIPKERIAQQRARYFRFLEGILGETTDHRYLVDKNPSMITLIPGMLRLWPECKLIIALRDPRDVVLSCFFRYFPLNSVSVQFLDLDTTVSRYLRDLDAWFELKQVLPNGWVEVRYEDVVNNLQTEVTRVLDSLGLLWSDEMLNYREMIFRRPTNSPTYEQVAQPLHQSSIGRWRNYEKWMAPHLSRLGRYLELLGYHS